MTKSEAGEVRDCGTGRPLSELRRMLAEAGTADAYEIMRILESDSRKGAQDLLRKYRRSYEQQEKEERRLCGMWAKEWELQQTGYTYVAGVDEAGRGPLAGPVVAASVILPLGLKLPKLNDSKKLAPKDRAVLARLIKEKSVAWGIGLADQRIIERINILEATKKAMLAAVQAMSKRPDFLIIDAIKINAGIKQEGIIHGDSLCASIAAASILAKTFRDDFMEKMNDIYPEYGFSEHKGYGTPRHLAALREFGLCPLHRKNFCSGLL